MFFILGLSQEIVAREKTAEKVSLENTCSEFRR